MGCNFSNPDFPPAGTNDGKEGIFILDNKISLNNYTMQKAIGRGGFGRVWKAENKTNRETVAIKVMSKVKVYSKNSVHNILNEFEFMKTIDHPFVLKAKAAFQDKDNLYLVMDFLTGGDLRYHILSGVIFTELETKFIVCCLILALEYLHHNKIVHRDVKPENLIFDSNGYIQLADLGVARRLEKDKELIDTSGTPGYMAPEVVNKLNHGYPADYYSLGVIIYEIMKKKRPYKSTSRTDLKYEMLSSQITISPLKIPEGWSLESADFTNKLLKTKVTERLGYKGIQELKNHPWFDGVDWPKLYKKTMHAPFIPYSEDNYNNKSVSKRDPPITGANNILSNVNKKRYFQAFYFDPRDLDTKHKTIIMHNPHLGNLLNEKTDTCQDKHVLVLKDNSPTHSRIPSLATKCQAVTLNNSKSSSALRNSVVNIKNIAKEEKTDN